MRQRDKKTIEISHKTYERLANWPSLRDSLSCMLSQMDSLYAYAEDFAEEEDLAEIKRCIVELQQLTDPLDEINLACKNRLTRDFAVSQAIRRK